MQRDTSLKKIVIGIQARSTSTRYPNKVMQLVDGVPMVEAVIRACKKSEKYINPYKKSQGFFVDTVLLVPTGDALDGKYPDSFIKTYAGSEHDVLTRYVEMAALYDADYVVRITADCPMVKHAEITKIIKSAFKEGIDYNSNVLEECRTSFDGMDIEIVTRKALDWLNDNCKDKSEREHVTMRYRKDPPPWLRRGVVIGHVDLSGFKLSVDDKDDLERVNKQVKSINTKISNAEKLGVKVFRF